MACPVPNPNGHTNEANTTISMAGNKNSPVVVLMCNDKYFFYWLPKIDRNFQCEQYGRRVVAPLDSDNGLSGDANSCRKLLLRYGTQLPHLTHATGYLLVQHTRNVYLSLHPHYTGHIRYIVVLHTQLCEEVNVGWRLPFDRMRVMSALETLTQGWDATAARDVVLAFYGAPSFAHSGSEWRWKTPGTQSHVDGLTELGPFRHTENTPGSSKTFGAPQEDDVLRVGRFKVYILRKRRYQSVIFYDFRSDTRIPGELPGERWQLLYDAEELKPLILSRLVPTPSVMRWRDQLLCWYLRFRYGVPVRFDSHHLKPVVMHSELPEDNT